MGGETGVVPTKPINLGQKLGGWFPKGEGRAATHGVGPTYVQMLSVSELNHALHASETGAN